MNRVRTVLSGFDRLFRAIAMLALFVLVLVVPWDVTGRTLFDAPLGFVFELAAVLLGIALYTGLIGANWRRSHVQIDLFAQLFDRYPGFEKFRNGLSWCCEIVFFSIVAAMILRQALTVARWGETYYFLPLEKSRPMMALAVLAAIAAAVLLLRLFRLKPEDDA